MREEKEKMKVAIYLRQARANESDICLESQRKVLREFSEQYLKVKPVEYCDIGSGRVLDRPEFQAMMRALSAGEINTVLVRSMSRLGRDLTTVANALEMIKNSGGRVLSLEERITVSQLMAAKRYF